MQLQENKDEFLVPATIQDARTALVHHPLGNTLAQQSDNYAQQLAKSDLGYDSPTGRKLWTVSKVALYGPNGQAWPGAYGTQRDDNNASLGLVGQRYTVLQNEQLAQALELAFAHLPTYLRPKIENAGALGGGSGFGPGGQQDRGVKVYSQLALPNELSKLLSVPQDKDSPTKAYLTLTNTHDGSASAILGAAATRIVCRNTFRMANKEASQNGFKLSHVPKNIEGYQAKVSEWLKAVGANFADMGGKMRHYASKPLGAEAVKQAATEILFGEVLAPEKQTAQQKAKVSAIIEMIESRDGQFVPMGDVTAYSVLQSVTAYEMHRRPARGSLSAQTETRLWRVLTGSDTVGKAFEVLDRFTV